MKRFSLLLGVALAVALIPFPAAFQPLEGIGAAMAHPDPAEAPAATLETNLGLPFAKGLIGASDAPVFACVVNRAGVRNVWVALGNEQTRLRTAFTQDDEVEDFRPLPDGTALVYSANPGDLDARQIWQASLAGGKSVQRTPSDRVAFFPVFGGNQLTASVTDTVHPAHPVLVDTMKPLGPVATAKDYATPQVVTFASTNGPEIHGQLFPGQGKGPHPALVFVHGRPRQQMLPGYSTMYYYNNAYAHNQARDGASEYLDVLAGGQWLANQSGVDPERIGIWGGYLTALALARNSDLFKAGADFHGVHAMVREVDKTYSPTQEQKIHQLQWDSSPMGAIAKWRSPVLIIHGDDDGNVDFNQSLLLARELTARKIPFEELAFPNERHDFFRFADWLTSYRATDAFFAKYLQGQPAKEHP